MSFEQTIRMLKSGSMPTDPESRKRRNARCDWTRATVAALDEAQQRCDAAWERLVKALPEDATEDEIDAIQPPPEQAEVDALHALIDDVVKYDKWPRELYWGGI